MWGYYGSKSKIVKKYPKPINNIIIEPFSGTAMYSLDYFENDVILIDKYHVIVDIWKWLQKCSVRDILTLPILEYGQSVDDFEWDCVEAKWLMGFIITGGATQPKKSPSKWKTLIRPNTQNYKLNFIANNLYKIKHWKIYNDSYDNVENCQATWFIDPPYQVGGKYYKFGSNLIDYNKLSDWCLSRNGQIIVCENDKASWLPFQPLCNMQGIKNNSMEMFYTNI